MREKTIDKTAISAFANYCDGYARPGAQGLGYVSVLKVMTGTVEKTNDDLLDGIVAYDRAEADGAYIGQINMETASSFCGIAGQIWGYDLAVADEIANDEQKPILGIEAKQYDGSMLPAYDAKPLFDAGIALFGTTDARRFPPAPGAHVICANKSVTQSEVYGVWAYIAISITRDRDNSADLFIEDAGVWNTNDNEDDLKAFLDKHRQQVMWSIASCGQDQRVLYDRTYIGYHYTMVPEGHVGTALSVAPYITLAKNAVPKAGFDALNQMTLSEWENEMDF